MQYYRFIDNFRGFSDTLIPITDVNFLVGENSTGKTSVLGLLKMLSGPGFLFDLELSDEDVGFRHFSDMVSAHSKKKIYFRIGFVWEESKAKGRKPGTVTGCLLTYVEEDGLPSLSKVTFSRGLETITLSLRRPSYYFKVEKRRDQPTVQELVSALRSQWVKEHAKLGTNGYRKLVTPPDYSGRIPLMFALSLISARTGRARKARSTKDAKDQDLPEVPYTAFPPDLTWLAPIRTKSQRTYDEWTLDFSPEGKHTPYVISKMLHSKPARKFRDLITKFGRASSLFQNIRTKDFGRGATAPFELDVVLDGKALNIINVGYGVSQSLPVLVEAFARSHGTWFAIQQPEVHLHPRAQATLGDVFFDMAAFDHKLFLIETHSDFTIDRFRMNYRRKLKYKPDSQVLFFERRNKRNIVTPLRVDKVGNLPSNQPESYRDFFLKEGARLLGI